MKNIINIIVINNKNTKDVKIILGPLSLHRKKDSIIIKHVSWIKTIVKNILSFSWVLMLTSHEWKIRDDKSKMIQLWNWHLY